MTFKSRLALRFLLALGVLGALLFIPAGSLRFWQGWAYIAISFVPGLFAFTYFYKHDPQLIERRMQIKQKVREQKRIMTFVYIAWLVAFVLPGLDHRFGWFVSSTKKKSCAKNYPAMRNTACTPASGWSHFSGKRLIL